MTVEEWLNGNQLSLDIWHKKYQVNGENFKEWLDRVSGDNKEVRQLIIDKKFIFGGRILAGRGIKDSKKSLSNCYCVKAPEDNIPSILEAAKKLAVTYSRGGGCGLDVSNLRPKGAITHNAAKESTGPTSFMELYSYITGLISQQGRRGALVLTLDCHHPDIEEFINLKTKQGICEKANISIRVTNDFMHTVFYDRDWVTTFDSPETGVITRTFKARDLLRLLAKRNWEWAEPGLLYWDTICNYNMLNTDPEFEYGGVNPCCEEPLPAGGSCLLGSLNLSEFVLNPFTSVSTIDTDSLRKAVHIAVEALNHVLMEGLSLHPLEEQRESVSNWRQIGLGTMGMADLLIKMGVTYGSQEACTILSQIYYIIAKEAILTSLDLAKTLGSYPKCKPELLIESTFIKSMHLNTSILEDIEKYGLYNSQLLTCAPTGSIATMLQVSTGVEPNFALKYIRKTQSLDGKDTFYEVNAKIVEDYIATTGKAKLPEYFIESKDIAPIDRIKMQSILQRYTDAAISSTINLPKEATVDDIYNIYVEAWKHGLKGCTVYRSGCYREGILSTDTNKNESGIEKSSKLQRGEIIPTSNNWIGLKRTLHTGCGSLHCTAYFDPNDGELRECYLSKGSTGGCQQFMIGLSRLISLSARGGIGIEAILDQLKSCGVCPSYAVRTATRKDTSPGSCCPVAVGKALREMYNEMQERISNKVFSKREVKINERPNTEYEECPECHVRSVTHIGGCSQCSNCGWSRCD